MVPATPFSEAPIVVVPAETGCAKPLLLMVATLVALDVHAAEVVTSPFVPSENVALAVNCCDCPPANSKVGSFGVTVIAVMIFVLTVKLAVLVTLLLLDLAVIVVVPSATARARPPESMVATPVEEETQLTWEVTSPVVLLPKVAVAVNCCVPLGRMKAPLGESVSETIWVEAGKNPPQLLSKRAAVSAAAILPEIVTNLISICRYLPA